MEFILPLLIGLAIAPVCIGLAGVVFLSAIFVRANLQSDPNKPTGKTTAKVLFAGLTAFAIFTAALPLLVLFLPCVAESIGRSTYEQKSNQHAHEFVDWFAAHEAEFRSIATNDDPKLRELKQKLQTYGDLTVQIGSTQEYPREIAFLRNGKSEIYPPTLAEMLNSRNLRYWRAGEPFEGPSFNFREGPYSDYSCKVPLRADQIKFVARRSKTAGDGIDIDFYSDFAQTWNEGHPMQPIHTLVGKLLGQYIFENLLNEVHLKPSCELPRTETNAKSIDQLYDTCLCLMTEEEKNVLEGKVTSETCLAVLPCTNFFCPHRNETCRWNSGIFGDKNPRIRPDRHILYCPITTNTTH